MTDTLQIIVESDDKRAVMYLKVASVSSPHPTCVVGCSRCCEGNLHQKRSSLTSRQSHTWIHPA
jgi:hypothetical protein